MKTYVVGFVYMHTFSETGLEVLLIKKKHPSWQFDKFNGVGGHIEEGEFPAAAMQREFKEETDCFIPAELWRLFCTLQVVDPDKKMEDNGTIYVYSTFPKTRPKIENVTDEVLYWVNVKGLDNAGTIDNLKWLVPMGCAVSPVVLTGKEVF